MASTPAVVDEKAQEHCKRRQRARLRRLVVDENAQQHRPYYCTMPHEQQQQRPLSSDGLIHITKNHDSEVIRGRPNLNH